MSALTDYFPNHVWVILLSLAAISALGFFVPPSFTAQLGFSVIEHIIAVGTIELGSAVGIGALVVTYRDPPEETDDSEWRYDP